MIIFKVIFFIFGMSCFFDAGLNLMECGDRIGKKYKKSNIFQLIIGFLIMTAVFFV